MGKTTVDLTEKAQAVKEQLMPIFGLKNILSAGLLLFNRLSSREREQLVADANGIELGLAQRGLSDEQAAAEDAE